VSGEALIDGGVYTVRAGSLDDAPCLAVLAMQVFLDTYAPNGIRPDLAREALTVYSPEAFGARLREPDAAVDVVEREGHLVAFIDVAPADASPAPGIEGPEVRRLYVQAPFKRQGIGRALLQRAERRLAARGAAVLWLTAYAGNAGALAFYPALGYADAGRRDHVFEGQRYENRIFVKKLAPAQTTSTGATSTRR
jgi:diamine N-acetyltransferase